MRKEGRESESVLWVFIIVRIEGEEGEQGLSYDEGKFAVSREFYHESSLWSESSIRRASHITRGSFYQESLYTSQGLGVRSWRFGFRC